MKEIKELFVVTREVNGEEQIVELAFGEIGVPFLSPRAKDIKSFFKKLYKDDFKSAQQMKVYVFERGREVLKKRLFDD